MDSVPRIRSFYGKARELRRPHVDRAMGFPDEMAHLFLDRRGKRLEFLLRALHLDVDAAVRKVLHVSDHLEFARHLKRGVPEPDALHVAFEVDVCVVHVRHDPKPFKQMRRKGNHHRAPDAHSLFVCFFRTPKARFFRPMDNFYSDGSPENEWEDRGDLAWNEFDWEHYLRDQEDVIHRYLGFYEAFRKRQDRIDLVAEQMGWESPDDGGEEEAEETAAESDDAVEFTEDDVYTLHKNPVYVATKAIYLGIRRPWEFLASDAKRVPSPLALSFLVSLHRGEEQAVQAIHALDFGDFAMAVSLFKRALGALNDSLTQLNAESSLAHAAVRDFREDALPRLFDLREVWLRVINESRRELRRPIDEES